jgi:ATPase subunit of ABC transporter with duplicated ATPase domains
LNPFIWHRPLSDPEKMVEDQDFAELVALKLKSGANVSLFGPRDIGKTSFLSTLTRELAKEHASDAPAYTTLTINLKRGLSIQGIISCIRESLEDHPSPQLRTIAKSAIDTVETELGFNVRLLNYKHKRTPKT